MTDLHDRLAALRTTPPATDEAVVTADLRRGRRAHARRRTARLATTGAFALTVGGATTAAVTSTHDHSTHEPHGVRLVDYTGQQLPGFTITKIPEGFVLQGVTAGVLDVARPGDHSSLDDFTNKIVVTLEDTSPAPRSAPGSASSPIRLSRDGDILTATCPDGTVKHIPIPKDRFVGRPCDTSAEHAPASEPTPAVDQPFHVDGSAGTVTTNSEGTKTFRYAEGDLRVDIQAWPTLGLTDAQLKDFADGVSVTADAQLSHG